MNDKMTNHIARQLKNVRTDKQRMTQIEVAKKAGINVNYYAKLERGEATPSLKTLEKILKVLKTKSSEILPF